MNYIVIETHDGAAYAIIVTDENGENKVFKLKAMPRLPIAMTASLSNFKNCKTAPPCEARFRPVFCLLIFFIGAKHGAFTVEIFAARIACPEPLCSKNKKGRYIVSRSQFGTMKVLLS